MLAFSSYWKPKRKPTFSFRIKLRGLIARLGYRLIVAVKMQILNLAFL